MKAKPFLIFSGERELKKLQKKLWELRLKKRKLNRRIRSKRIRKDDPRAFK